VHDPKKTCSKQKNNVNPIDVSAEVVDGMLKSFWIEQHTEKMTTDRDVEYDDDEEDSSFGDIDNIDTEESDTYSLPASAIDIGNSDAVSELSFDGKPFRSSRYSSRSNSVDLTEEAKLEPSGKLKTMTKPEEEPFRFSVISSVDLCDNNYDT
jgi:hypothetical protein